MPITIRNKRIEERLRKLCELRGEGPSATIGHLVEKELKELIPETDEARFARRRKAQDGWIASLPPVSEEDRRTIDRFMAEMYDEHGLPR